MAISADGKQVVSASSDQSVIVWNSKTGKVMKKMESGKSQKNVFVSANGQQGLSQSIGNHYSRWNLKTGKLSGTRDGLRGIRPTAFNPDGKQALFGSFSYFSFGSSFGSNDNKLHVWDFEKETEQTMLSSHKGKLQSVAVTSDGKFAITGSDDKTIKIWDLKTRKNVRTLKGHQTAINKVVISANSKKLLSLESDRIMKVWDFETGTEKFENKKWKYKWVDGLALSHDGQIAVLGIRNSSGYYSSKVSSI